MTEPLHGPWLIAVSHVDPLPQFSFIISGANNANGRHPIEAGYEVAVDGEEWSIDFEAMDIDVDTWRPVATLRRETKFIPLNGLAVVLDTRPRPSTTGWFGPLRLGAALTCTSQDPEASPVPSRSLPDFTIPRD